MAKVEHLRILRQGVDAWNQWRLNNPGVSPSLCNADLRRMNFVSPLFSGLDLTNADLRGANLDDTYLEKADFSQANLSTCKLRNAVLRWTKLNMANFRNSDLSAADLNGASIIIADFSEANLSKSRLAGAYVEGGTFSQTNFEGADLFHTDFKNVDLTEAILTSARIGETTFLNLDLSSVHGLESLYHTAPSTIGIDTIIRSHGHLPQVFLQGAGIPDHIIGFVRSLANKPFEFYSCFISYSSGDQRNVERMHADLQASGVRCWFAPEDMKIGDPIRPRIDESIRLHDKVLLVLSESSLASTWVADEVEAALEKERRQSKTVLFPITLDNAVWDSNEAWAAKIRRERHIGDFRQWKNHDAYQVALERLLRDLKAEGE